MNLELFIAKRIHSVKSDEDKEVTRPAVKIAIGGIATGLAVMILAIAIVVGFKTEVRNKLIGFGSHIQVTGTMEKNEMVTVPISLDENTLQELRSQEHIRHIQKFTNQPGIIKTDDNFKGIVMKGVDENFDWDFFKSNLTEGDIAHITADSISKEIVISKKISEMLNVKVGDKLPTYFIIDGKVRVRPFIVSGIYATGFSDYDQVTIIGDMKHILRLNGWEDNQSGGLEILVDDYDNLDVATQDVFSLLGNTFDTSSQTTYNINSIKDINPQIFSWLDMLDINVVIILVLMTLVAGFTIISGLLILILQKTNMIGILKSLGSRDWSIRKIFLYQTIFLVGKGMLIGNIVGLAICFVQWQWHLMGLDPEVYYVDSVPISLSFGAWLLLNIGVFIASLLMLIGPSYIITKISPADAVRFE